MKSYGFTLAELLISLAILGVIATFTIPKVLNSQQDATNVSIAKEVASMVSGAYQTYQLNNTVTTTTGIDDLTPYFNYVSIDTTTTVDIQPFDGNRSCGSPTIKCFKLHNGGILHYSDANSFPGTTVLHTIPFCIDPNGDSTSVEGLCFLIYYNGRLTTRANAMANSCSSVSCTFGANAGYMPAWFSWN